MDNIAERIQATQKAFKQWSVGIKEMDKIRQEEGDMHDYHFVVHRDALIKRFELFLICFGSLAKFSWKKNMALLLIRPVKLLTICLD